MKALSIRQPWAWAILHAGKDVENRDWKPANPGRRYRGRFLIHASGGMTRAEYDDFADVFLRIAAAGAIPPGVMLPAFDALPRGGIVGRAKIAEVRAESTSPWFFGPIGLVLADVEPMDFVPCKGALGFFEPDIVFRATAQTFLRGI